MARRAGDRRNWRPNVLLFDESGHARHGAIREFATTLASGNGLVTEHDDHEVHVLAVDLLTGGLAWHVFVAGQTGGASWRDTRRVKSV
mgnify:CR=1 FL=1